MSTEKINEESRINEGRYLVSPQQIPVTDIEEGRTFKELKSILKKEIGIEENRKNTGERIIKLIFTLIIIVIVSPIIICDFYFGLNDNSCVEEMSDKLAINLQTYLVVSAAVSFFMIAVILLSGCNMSTSNSDSKNECILCLLSFISIIFNIFNTIWNILGGIIFWNFAYKNNLCDKNVSTYLFISLIMKYIANYFALNNAFTPFYISNADFYKIIFL